MFPFLSVGALAFFLRADRSDARPDGPCPLVCSCQRWLARALALHRRWRRWRRLGGLLLWGEGLEDHPGWSCLAASPSGVAGRAGGSVWRAFGCPRGMGRWVQPVGPRPLATWVSLKYGLFFVSRQVLYEFVDDPYGRLPVGQLLAEAARGVGKRRELFVAFLSVQQVVHLCAFFRFLLDVEPYDLVVGLKLPFRRHGGRVAQCGREPFGGPGWCVACSALR